MNKSIFAQPAARLGIALALVFSLVAPLVGADPARSGDTQTDDGNYVKGRGRAANTPSSTIEINEPITFDMTQNVHDRAEQEITQDNPDGQYIFGREDEVAALNEALSLSDGHVAAIKGDPKSGRTGVMEEYARLHPQDKVRRLNLKKLSLLNEVEATTTLKKLIYDLENENIAAKGDHRVILFIENLASLQQGSTMKPISALWEQIMRGVNLNFVLESDPATLDAELKPGKEAQFKSLANLVRTVEVKPPSYDAVLSYMLRSRPALEKSGVKISIPGLQEAARIAVKHFSTSTFKYAYALAEAATKLVGKEQAAGQSTAAKINGSIKQLQALKKTLTNELADKNTPANERQQLTAQLAQVEDDLTAKGTELEILNTPTDNRTKAAKLELDLIAKNKQLEEAKKNLGMFQRDTPEITVLKSEIRGLTARKISTDAEITGSEDDTGKPATRVGVKQIVSIASKWLKIPVNRLSANLEEGIAKIEDIKNVVYGQDHVLKAIEGKLQINRSHLNDGKELTPDEVRQVQRGTLDDSVRPVGSFWFAGSTGVGKTEIAKQIADATGYELLRFDMSEFQEKHFVSRLIGAPPGYVGYENPGELPEGVRITPERVVLLDEIEKAHPDILNVLLQVLDDGRLTDNHGRTVDFRKTIIIMTSNLAQEIGGWDEAKAAGFLKDHGWTLDDINSKTRGDLNTLRKEAYKVYVTDPVIAAAEKREPMRKEFLNRIDDILMFNKLDSTVQVMIMQKTMKQFVWRLKEFYHIQVRFTSELLSQLAATFNEAEGGRSVRRNFDDFIRAPIAQLVVDKSIGVGSNLLVGLNDQGGLDLSTTTPERLAAAEAQAKAEEGKTSSAGKPKTSPEESAKLKEMKDGLEAQGEQQSENRAARAATAALIEKIFNKDWLIGKRAYELLRK